MTRKSKCCVPHCTSFYSSKRKNPDAISTFRFPKNDARRKLWIKTIFNDEDCWTPTSNSVVCLLHFHQDDFRVFAARTKLKRTAVPCIFPTPPAESTESNTVPSSVMMSSTASIAKTMPSTINSTTNQLSDILTTTAATIISAMKLERDPQMPQQLLQQPSLQQQMHQQLLKHEQEQEQQHQLHQQFIKQDALQQLQQQQHILIKQEPSTMIIKEEHRSIQLTQHEPIEEYLMGTHMMVNF